MTTTDIAISAESIISEWSHLPYQFLHSQRKDAVSTYVGRFKNLSDANISCDEGAQRMAILRGLESESHVLGLRCGRLEPLVLNVESELTDSAVAMSGRFIRETLERSKTFDHISSVVACADMHTQLALRSADFRLADTILGYHAQLDSIDLGDNDSSVRESRADDVEELSKIAFRCFCERKMSGNRFAMDPAFASEAVGNLYASWLRAAILELQADRCFVFDDGEISGFMTFKLPIDLENEVGYSMGKAVLSGVLPERQGLGIYRRLLLAGARWLKSQGVEKMEGKTQITTVPAIRAWQKIGASLNITYHTFHWSNQSAN
ncbi:MAG: hypothetical protein C0469_00980 [Cyanobacteria bacterium DS2.3.42]|nr:hypothetical protein [Cyanobacteria bacterium DS2.3.42]